MSVNAREETFERIELFGKPALFTNFRIDRSTVPEGIHCYDIRGSDYDPGKLNTVEKNVGVNHAAAILTAAPITMAKDKDYRRISGKINFLSEDMTLSQFCEEQGIVLRTPQFVLRPASANEVGLFYTQAEKDAELGTVGHLRFDMGSSGKEFHSTWWEHNNGDLKTAEFKAELDTVINELRENSLLKSRDALSAYCHNNGSFESGMSDSYGFVAETESYRYCFRLTPRAGDYCYCYVYDKHQQELAMAENAPQEGMTMGGLST